MKKKIFIVSIFILLTFAPITFVVAAQSDSGGLTKQIGDYTMLVPIPTSSGGTPATDLGGYLQLIFELTLGFAGVLAVVMITIGGFRYIIAGDSESEVSGAKNQIKAAIFGLILAIFAWLLVFTINPNILNFSLVPTGSSENASLTPDLPANSVGNSYNQQGYRYNIISTDPYPGLSTNTCETVIGRTWHQSNGCDASTPTFWPGFKSRTTHTNNTICCAENTQERASSNN